MERDSAAEGAVRSEVAYCELKEACRRAQAPAVFGVGGVLEVFLQVDVGARQLDETLVESGVPFLKPELFEDVVCLVVGLSVETEEEGLERGGRGTCAAWAQGLKQGGHPVFLVDFRG